MNESNASKIMTSAVTEQSTTIPSPSRDVLTEILRDGAQRLLGHLRTLSQEDLRLPKLRDDLFRRVTFLRYDPTSLSDPESA